MTTTLDDRTYTCTVLNPEREPHGEVNNENPLTMTIVNNLLAAMHAAGAVRGEIQYPDSETGAIWSFYIEAT